MKRAFIFGAGSSVYAGGPLTDQFLPCMKQKFGSEPEFQRILKIEQNALDLTDNIEHLFTLLDIANISDWPLLYDCSIDELKDIRERLRYYVTRLVSPQEIKDNNGVMERFTSRLGNGDIVLTFNYDILVEQALWKNCLWRPTDGYSLSSSLKTHPGLKQESKIRVQLNRMKRYRSTVPVLKLHGSVNWRTDNAFSYCKIVINNHFENLETIPEEKTETFYMPEYWGMDPTAEQSLVMPSLIKLFDHPYLKEFWSQAHQVLSEVTDVYIIGYSLPQADVLAEYLFRISLKVNNHLSKVCVVNPSCEVHQRFYKLLVEELGLGENIFKFVCEKFEHWDYAELF